MHLQTVRDPDQLAEHHLLRQLTSEHYANNSMSGGRGVPRYITAGAMIPPRCPIWLQNPRTVFRTEVGNSSPVYRYAWTPLNQHSSSSAKQTRMIHVNQQTAPAIIPYHFDFTLRRPCNPADPAEKGNIMGTPHDVEADGNAEFPVHTALTNSHSVYNQKAVPASVQPSIAPVTKLCGNVLQGRKQSITRWSKISLPCDSEPTPQPA